MPYVWTNLSSQLGVHSFAIEPSDWQIIFLADEKFPKFLCEDVPNKAKSRNDDFFFLSSKLNVCSMYCTIYKNSGAVRVHHIFFLSSCSNCFIHSFYLPPFTGSIANFLIFVSTSANQLNTAQHSTNPI